MVMMRATLRTTCAALLLAMVAALLSSAASAQSDQRKLVSAATFTLSGFLNDPDMRWLKSNFNRAKAVLIAPTITKAGFIIGGSGGRALVLARDEKTGKWVGPAFYVLATGSVGFQAGVSVSETVSLVMTEKGLDSLLSSSFKFGGDVSVAAGPIGTGAQSDLVADFVSFSRSKGIYGGLSLDGRYLEPPLLRKGRDRAGYPDPGIGPSEAGQRIDQRGRGRGKKTVKQAQLSEIRERFDER
jgi:lipid-binding SYLF domain-containing protein